MMSRLRQACLLFAVSLGFLVSPSSAQDVEPPPAAWSIEPEEDKAPAPPPAKKEAPPPKPAPKPAVELPTAPLPEPVVTEPPPVPEEVAPEVEDRSPLLALFLSLLGVGIVLFILERVRSWITVNVPLRRITSALVILLRIAGVALVLAIVLKLIPGGREWILWALVIIAIVTGWSVRDLFADLVAGVILAAERRIKKGVWVSGDGFQGTVEGRSLRATWLRDGQGHRLTVPNRAMVGAPMVSDAGADAEYEVVVRLEGYDDASSVRQALNDAILSSPWALAGATPIVLRDPADPVVWRVRSRLLEPRFSVHFEGELLERVEDLLRYEPITEERDTEPGEIPDDAKP